MKKIVVLFTSLLLLSCSSDDNTNSNPIPTGSDTVTFSFNDENFSTTNNELNFEKSHVFINSLGSSLIMVKISNMEKETAVELTISSEVIFEEGKTYAINGLQTANLTGRIFYYGNKIPSMNCYTNNEIGGSLTVVKLDYQRKIFAAIFNFNAVEENGTMHSIKNGWLDLKI